MQAPPPGPKTGTKKPVPFSTGSPEITEKLRRASYRADAEAIAEILSSSSDIVKLGDGLKFYTTGAKVVATTRR